MEHLASTDASLSHVSLLYSDFNYLVREVTINCKSEEHANGLIRTIPTLDGITLLESRDDTFHIHRGGKLEVISRIAVKTTDELSRAYTPGVARICQAIAETRDKAYDYTIKGNMIAVVTDGSAVLGLGDIGPEAALPVMEGKAVLFKEFAGLDAFPICLATQDTEEVIRIVKALAPTFGGINLEDIGAPRCFEIEQRLREELDIPVFHDDQHGTAAVVLAGLLNSLKIVGKKLSDIKIVVNGFGAGGVACTRMLLAAGAKNIIPCDRAGIVYRGRSDRMNPVKEELMAVTNPDNEKGTVADALRGADVFIGVSKPGSIDRKMVSSMNDDRILFALANPVPEIMPDEVKDIVRVIATGRSDFANQVNNVLCFPGIFRGALDVRARDITDNMKIAAAQAIAECVKDSDLHERNVIPSVFQADVAERVAQRVREAALNDGVARIQAREGQ
ncbi:MAG: NAD-dependent malic enzyme [Bdellovibrionales bacterium]|nr:NAD-dependent malic enzyme [Bdellovibrionales bacterium]